MPGSTLDKVFRALGDETRRSMLEQLSRRGECTAGELGAPFDIRQPSASKHIKSLQDAGLVTRRVAGRTHYFRIAPAPLDEARDWLTRHRELWQSSLDQLDAMLRKLPARPDRKKP